MSVRSREEARSAASPFEQQIAPDWNSTAAPFPEQACIHQIVEEQVTRTPDATAVVMGEQRLSYSALNRRANQLAHLLQARGVGPEVCVGICMERSPEMIVALLAVLKAGGAFLPLDPAYPAERLAFMISDACLPVLLTQQRLVERLPAQAGQIITLDAQWPTIARQPAHTPTSSVTARNLAYVIYTSGSTGRPKGVLIEHQGLVNISQAPIAMFGVGKADRVLQFASFSFDASIFEIFLALLAGAALHLAPPDLLPGPALTDLLRAEAITSVVLTPSTLALLDHENLPSLRTVIAGAEECPAELVMRWLRAQPDRVFFNAYGPTEVTIWATTAQCCPDGAKPTIGRPIANKQIYILGDRGDSVPLGEPGELCIAGVGLARGYLNRPDLTAEKFIPNPFSQIPGARQYRTGDLARYRPDGDLEFLGRIDQQVKLRGFRIELGEIESVLMQHPAVQAATVIVREDRQSEKRLVAYVVQNQEARTKNQGENGEPGIENQGQESGGSRSPSGNPVLGSPQELRAFLNARLPAYMVPSAFVQLDALPRTPGGKLDRRALPAPEDDRSELPAFVAPRTPVEERIAAIWADVLKREQVGRDDHFFEIGGHSLLAAQVLSRLRDAFQVEIPPRRLFNAPTIAGLAEQVEQSRHARHELPPLNPRSPKDGNTFPLSFAQQRLWFLQQLAPNSASYNVSTMLRLTGSLNIAALEQSLNEIVRRHEALRTTFVAVDEQPVQVIGQPVPLMLSRIDLQSLSRAEQETRLQELAIADSLQPFDLASGPLIRAALIRLGDSEHVLLCSMHHIITDGWSQSVLVREMGELYRSFAAGRPSSLAPLPVQYADYTLWQRQWMQGQVLDRQLAYWRQQLHEPLPVLALPTDRPRPLVQTEHGASYRFSIPQDLTTTLGALSRRDGATLFMTLLAAFKVVLARYSGQSDLLVGSPVAGRTHAATEDLIGFFVNTLVLRTNLGGNPSFRELLGRVRDVTLDAYAHADTPFEKLVEAIQPQRDLSRTPLFQVMFALQNVPPPPLDLPDLSLELLDPDRQTTPFDLSLTVAEQADGLAGTLEYNTDLFDASTAQRMTDHLLVVLASVADDPEQRIGYIPLLTQAERQIVGWDSVPAAYPDDLCIHTLIAQQADLRPDALAVVFEDRQLTYEQLNRRANQLAHVLQNNGVGPEARVGLCMERSPELIVGLLAILKAGGAYVPLDPAYPAERLAFMLEDAQADLVLTQERLLEQIPAEAGTIICLDRDWEMISRQPAAEPVCAVQPDNLAYVIYTSGSTGQPKGAMVQHRSLVAFTLMVSRDYQIDASDRMLQFTSLSWDTSVEEIFPCLAQGATLVLRPSNMLDSMATFVRTCATASIRVLNLPTAVWHMLAASLAQEHLILPPTLRLVIIGGERALPEHLAAWRAHAGSRIRLLNTYGLAEATVEVSMCEVSKAEAAERDLREVSIGRPFDAVAVYLLDANLQPVPVGVPGEIFVGGGNLARGYLSRPGLTAERFLPDPFSSTPGKRMYRSGDVGRYRADGQLEFVGRTDHQVKIRGHRVELGEIEAALSQHPAVREALVVVRTHPSGDNQLIAYVVAPGPHPPAPSPSVAGEGEPSRTSPAPAAHERGGEPASAGKGWRESAGVRADLSPSPAGAGEGEVRRTGGESLRAFLREQLPDYMIPSAIVPLDTFPLTPNGKIDTRALPAPDLSRQAENKTIVPPRTPAEQQLAEIWQSVLGVAQISIDDDFFQLGGHSLLATKALSRIRLAFGLELPLRSLFEYSTLASLAEYINATEMGDQALSSIPPVARDQPLPTSFAQQRLWFLDRLQPGNPLYNIATELRLTGLLDVAALQHSLRAIVQRHEVLRTTFALVDDLPVQIIAPHIPVDLTVVDLQHLADAEREPAARQFISEAGRTPFDLTHGPLIRFALLRLTPEHHVLLLTCHHIVVDAWSDDILIRELATFYAAFVSGQPDEAERQLPHLPIQYADYAAWQRQWLQGETVQAHLAYWKQQLAGMNPTLDLITDRSRPPIPSLRGGFYEFALPQSLATACTVLSQREGVTLFMTLLAAFEVLLYRATGQTDLSIGSPIANRQQPEVEHLIGFFTNTLVLRARLAGNPSFLDVLRQVRDVTLDAYAHQELPFELLVEELRPDRDLSRSPLFQVLFVMRNISAPAYELPGIDLRLVEAHTGTAKFDLTLFLTEANGTLSGGVEYNIDLFDAATIARLVRQYHTLLEAAVLEPTQPISRLPLLEPAERRQLIETWNATQADYPDHHAVHQLVEAQVLRTPQAIAAVFSDRRLTYQQLNERANQLAHYLHRLGVGPGQCVGIYLDRSLELAIAVLGVLKAGAAYLPLDPSYPQDRLAFMIQDTHTPVLLTNARLIDALPAEVATAICLDRDWATIGQEATPNPAYAVAPSDLAYIIYTSGSTGTPKGVAMPHRPLVSLLAWQLRQSTLPGPCVTLQFAPLSFDASFQEMFSTWWSGGTLVLMPAELRQDPRRLLELMDEQAVERMFLPFVALHQLAEVVAAGQVRVPRALRELVTAGEQLYITDPIVNLFEQMRDGILYNYYGPSETHVVTALTLTGSPHEWPAIPTIGRPIANTQIYILDQRLEPVPVGIPGELYIGGDSLAQGYLDRPAITAEKFIPDPFSPTPGARLYRSGDIARWLPDGTIAFLGRSDHQVKVRGFRIELGEIEAALMQHEAVREAVVIMRDAGASGLSSGDRQLVAYVVAPGAHPPAPSPTHAGEGEPGGSFPSPAGVPSGPGEGALRSSGEGLRQFLTARLPDYMIPAAFVFLESIPITPSGKIDRLALPAPERARAGAQILPRSALELRLAQIWEDLLASGPIGVRDNFFEIGGHSLLAVRLQTRIAQQFGQQLPMTLLFQNPTIEQLAAILRQPLAEQAWSPLVALQPHGDMPPLFCVHGGDGSALNFMALARSLGKEQPFYGLQAAGLEGEQPPCASIPEMAARYIAALREIQPHGPYHLAGWSVGGVVAFEMAEQLARQGETIAQVLLLDSRADQYFAASQHVRSDDAGVLIEFLEEMGGTAGRRFGALPDDLDSLEPEQRLERLLEAARRAEIVPADLGQTQIRQRLAVFQANLRALESYTPPIGRQPLTVLRALDEPDGTEDRTLGWAGRTSAQIDVIDVPGTHYTMIASPQVDVLAEQLRLCLDGVKLPGD